MTEFFQYGEAETEYLKSRDARLAEVIEKIGPVKREVITDLFAALVNSIIGQQISTKAQRSIWERVKSLLGEVTPQNVLALPPGELRTAGFSFRKEEFIRSAAESIVSGDFDISALCSISDAEVCRRLSQLKGIGVWSAEMLMLFSMQRPDILSFGDLAIHRGLRMIYHHRRIDRRLFEKYRRRFSPCNSLASLYLWEVAGGAIEGMKDYAPKSARKK